LLGPYLIVRTHYDKPERAWACLCTAPSEPGEVVAQFASRRELLTNKGVIEMVTCMYYDATKGGHRPGIGASSKGGARRLAALLYQLDLNWYLYGMKSDEIMRLLPKEFETFKLAATALTK